MASWLIAEVDSVLPADPAASSYARPHGNAAAGVTWVLVSGAIGLPFPPRVLLPLRPRGPTPPLLTPRPAPPRKSTNGTNGVVIDRQTRRNSAPMAPSVRLARAAPPATSLPFAGVRGERFR
jgi:hypothetical protein